MTNLPKALFNWSGGKDSSFCLHQVLSEKKFDIQFLLTTINGKNKRISMHGVPERFLDLQAESIGLPLKKIYLPEYPTMQEYETVISNFLSEAKQQGINNSIFGDIFLDDLRQYREEQLAKKGFKAEFPLWKRNTTEIAKEFIQKGFKAIIVSVDSRFLDKSFAGRIFDESFLNDLPTNVDPCGENGEFHSFVFDCPVFNLPVLFSKGDIVYKEYDSENSKVGFWYCDLL